jgi:hypothetical protein
LVYHVSASADPRVENIDLDDVSGVVLGLDVFAGKQRAVVRRTAAHNANRR